MLRLLEAARARPFGRRWRRFARWRHERGQQPGAVGSVLGTLDEGPKDWRDREVVKLVAVAVLAMLLVAVTLSTRDAWAWVALPAVVAFLAWWALELGVVRPDARSACSIWALIDDRLVSGGEVPTPAPGVVVPQRAVRASCSELLRSRERDAPAQLRRIEGTRLTYAFTGVIECSRPPSAAVLSTALATFVAVPDEARPARLRDGTVASISPRFLAPEVGSVAAGRCTFRLMADDEPGGLDQSDVRRDWRVVEVVDDAASAARRGTWEVRIEPVHVIGEPDR